MRHTRTFYLFFLFLAWIISGCANIVPPTGGEKDVTPPVLLSITPADSLLNSKVTRIDMRFDEFVEISDVSKEVQISPLLPVPVNMTNIGKRVTLRIPDTVLMENTTYRISFGNAIKDLHEGNPFAGYRYTFSTGSYFDSLLLKGYVFNAATGMPDSGSKVILYDAARSDSAVVREKPLYVTDVSANGIFSFDGLPDRRFRIYALNDANNNLIFDGAQEGIAFLGETVLPTDSVIEPIVLNIFTEIQDITLTDSTGNDSLGKKRSAIPTTTGTRPGASAQRKQDKDDDEGFLYKVAVDTSSPQKRTVDVTKPVSISFNKQVDTLVRSRVSLVYDSLDTEIPVDFRLTNDTLTLQTLQLDTRWKENTVYTLRLLKGFARDSAGVEAMPSRYTFRTKNDDDYSKLNIHLPAKYYGKQYILMITGDKDTVYHKPVTDTLVHLAKLQPGTYALRVIVDKNENGKWDTGNLLEKQQPEEVIPYLLPVQLKAGWENTVDFEKEEKQKPGFSSSRQRRDTPPPRK